MQAPHMRDVTPSKPPEVDIAADNSQKGVATGAVNTRTLYRHRTDGAGGRTDDMVDPQPWGFDSSCPGPVVCPSFL
jgi:hypothetical protein